MQKSQFTLSHSLIFLRSRLSKLDSDAPEEISSGASESNLDTLLLAK